MKHSLQPHPHLALRDKAPRALMHRPTQKYLILTHPVDVKDIKYVINYDFPNNIEDYGMPSLN